MFNIPAIASQADNRCEIKMDVAMARTWPPALWYTATACALPACDIALALPFDHSGNWKVTTTTVATDCNATVVAADPRFTVGHVQTTGTAHALQFEGTCDYLPDGTTQMGTFRQNMEVTCELKDRPLGVKSLETSVVTFGAAGTATGTAKVFLYDIPAEAAQADNRCTIDMTVTMARQVD